MDRSSMLTALRDKNRVWDIAVIGGGATGLGIAWNATARGYSVALFDSGDFAHATSSRSTKLIHGGVRYLRQGQIGMVRSALHEREFLLRAARPWVWPLHMVIPSYRTGSRWYYYAGLKAYDWLAGKRNMQPAHLLSTQRVQQLLPNVQSQGLRGGVEFCDGQFDDARLAIAVAQQVVQSGQCALLNYSPVVGLDQGASTGLRVVTVQDKIAGEQFEVKAKVAVNATGVFADQVVRLEHNSDAASDPLEISPSRGTHIVLPGDFLGSSHALMIPETDDGRVLFAIPWLGHTLLGTTDIATSRVENEPTADRSEVDYLLQHAARYLSRAPERGDILSVFSGLRPLIGKSQGGATAKLSREHEIRISRQGLISVIGGKWTTFRKMGRDVLELAIEQGRLEQHPDAVPQLTITDQLVDEPAARLHRDLPITDNDIERAVRHEMALRVEDVMSRRTRCLLLNAQASRDLAPTVATKMAQWLGRDQSWIDQQIVEFNELAAHYLAD